MANLDDLKNVEAEKDILNVIMTHPQKLHDISRIIKADDFYRESHRLLYRAMAGMIISNEPLDMVTVAEKLRREGNLDKVGGIGLITNICMPGIVPDVKAEAQIIAEYARRRRIIQAARTLEAMAADLQEDIDQTAFAMVNEISGLTKVEDENTKTAKEGMLELAALIDRRTQPQDNLLNTGLIALDNILTSFEAGQLVVIAGRPGHGKTALAGTMAVNMAKRGKKILIFSMEMGRDELLGRFVSRVGDISGEKLKKPNEMTQKEWDQYIKGMEDVGELPITINTQGTLTPADVARIATRCKGQSGIDVIMIDYLQLMSSGSKSDNRVQEISYITRTLKNLAVSLKVPIILISQLSRANDKENRAPKLTDLRESGSIEQDANTVILINREAEKGEGDTVKLSNKAYVDVAKQRGGACGVVVLAFIASRGFFSDYIEVPM